MSPVPLRWDLDEARRLDQWFDARKNGFEGRGHRCELSLLVEPYLARHELGASCTLQAADLHQPAATTGDRALKVARGLTTTRRPRTTTRRSIRSSTWIESIAPKAKDGSNRSSRDLNWEVFHVGCRQSKQ